MATRNKMLDRASDTAGQDRTRAQQFGQQIFDDYTRVIGTREGAAQHYREFAAEAIERLLGRPGYTPEEAMAIMQTPEFDGAMMTAAERAGYHLTPDEITAIKGDPRSAAALFDPEALRASREAGSGIRRQALTESEQAIRGRASRPDFQLSPEERFLMTDKDIADLEYAAGRDVGARFGAVSEEMARRAGAAGVGALGITDQLAEVAREEARQSQDAMLDARLGARREARDAATNYERLRMGAEELNQSNARIAADAEMFLADIRAEIANMDAQELQALERYIQETGMSLEEYAEAEAQRRAENLALNRQGTDQALQQERYRQETDRAKFRREGAEAVGAARRQDTIVGTGMAAEAREAYEAGLDRAMAGRADAIIGTEGLAGRGTQTQIEAAASKGPSIWEQMLQTGIRAGIGGAAGVLGGGTFSSGVSGALGGQPVSARTTSDGRTSPAGGGGTVRQTVAAAAPGASPGIVQPTRFGATAGMEDSRPKPSAGGYDRRRNSSMPAQTVWG